MEIFEQYFYDVNQFNRVPGNETEYSDMLNVLEEKMEIFEKTTDVPYVPVLFTIGEYDISSISDIYRISMISYNDTNISSTPIIFEKVGKKEYFMRAQSPLTKGTPTRPIYTLELGGTKIITPVSSTVSPPSIGISYIRKPKKVEWAYVVVNNKPLYNDNISVGFELHPSEETELVHKILKLAGVNLKAPDVVQVGQALEQIQTQQEKQ
tara:strand:- start:895 stop:1521 length:627 start_codon:yes stop_codon:yes gene_type:complete